MYGQFFGSYLLNKKAVTPEQLNKAIEEMSSSHIKLGTLAMYKGYMTSEEVDECCYIQRRENKHFGEIALERSYLFEDQLEELLHAQTPNYLHLGQTLVDSGVLSNSTLQDLMIGYNQENIYDNQETDEEYDKHLASLTEIQNYFRHGGHEIPDFIVTYIHLLLKNLVRFIGNDFTPLDPVTVPEFETHYCVRQGFNGNPPYCGITRLDMEEDVAITFASRYADMEFEDFSEYVSASLEDFLNLQNGLFAVNLSNTATEDISLDPPVREEEEIVELDPTESVVIPLIYPFGTVYVVLSRNC